jgi:hypothetical protein
MNKKRKPSKNTNDEFKTNFFPDVIQIRFILNIHLKANGKNNKKQEFKNK